MSWYLSNLGSCLSEDPEVKSNLVSPKKCASKLTLLLFCQKIQLWSWKFQLQDKGLNLSGGGLTLHKQPKLYKFEITILANLI